MFFKKIFINIHILDNYYILLFLFHFYFNRNKIFYYIIMANFQFKRLTLSGDSSQPFLNPNTPAYRKAIFSCTIGAMQKHSQWFSYPLMAFYFLEKARQQK